MAKFEYTHDELKEVIKKNGKKYQCDNGYLIYIMPMITRDNYKKYPYHICNYHINSFGEVTVGETYMQLVYDATADYVYDDNENVIDANGDYHFIKNVSAINKYKKVYLAQNIETLRKDIKAKIKALKNERKRITSKVNKLEKFISNIEKNINKLENMLNT